MTAKEFLRKARDADRRVDEAKERAMRFRARLETGRMCRFDGMPGGGCGDWTDAADRLIELERRVGARIDELARLKGAAMDAIEGVEDDQLREVLELYYLDHMSWDKVAEKMNLVKRHVFRLHGKALQRIVVPEEFGH